MEVYYIYGNPGTGKTRFVKTLVDPTKAYYVNYYNDFSFIDYADKHILILDEFMGQFNLGFMNKLLSGDKVKSKCFKAFRPIQFDKIFIISNRDYLELYKNEQDTTLYNTFVKSLNYIIHLEKKI